MSAREQRPSSTQQRVGCARSPSSTRSRHVHRVGVAIATTVPLLAFSLTAAIAWLVVLVMVAVTRSNLGRPATRPRDAAVVGA